MRLTRLSAALTTAVAAASIGFGVASPAASATGSLALTGNCTGYYGSTAAGGFTSEAFSTPAVGDLYGNGVPWAVVGETDGTVQWWSLTTCAHYSLNLGGKIEASPVVVDLNHDGRLDVVVATMASPGSTHGRVVAFTPSLSNKVIFNVYTGYQNFATPAVGDLLGNGQLDVVEPSTDQHLYAWSSTGHLLSGFPVFFGDSAFSSPTITDLYGDGKKEIVFGFDCAGVQGQWCYPQHGGYLAAVRSNGSWAWKHFFAGQPVWSTPAVGDVDGDGKPDIVVGTGNMPCNPLPGQTSMCGGKDVYAVNYAGQSLAGWPVVTSGRTSSSPALGDVLGNNGLQVAITDDLGYLYLIRGTGSSGGVSPFVWKKCIYATCGSTGGPHSSAVIADLFHDGQQEVISSGEGSTGLYVFTPSGASVPVPSDTVFHSVTSAPTLAQVGGHAMIVSATSYPAGHVTYLGRWNSSAALGYSPWPTFKRTGTRAATLDDQEPVGVLNGGGYVLAPEANTIDEMTSTGLTAPSTMHPVVSSGSSTVTLPSGQVYEFVRGLTGSTLWCAMSGTSCSGGWHALNGITTAAPSATLLADGHTIEVAVSNGYAWAGSVDTTTGAFSGFTKIGGPTRGQVAVAPYGSGTGAVFAYTNTSGAEEVRIHYSTGTWGLWTNYGATSPVGPALVGTGFKQVDLLETSINHNIYERCVGSCSWTNWGGRAYSSPSAAYVAGSVQLYMVAADGRVQHRTNTTGWAALP